MVVVLACGLASCSGEKDAEIARLRSELANRPSAIAGKLKEEVRAKLWRDDKLEAVLKELGGYDSVIVFRWQRGVLEGWIEVDEESGPVQKRVDQRLQALKSNGKLQAKDCSGELVLALQKTAGSTDVYQLRLSQHFLFESDKKSLCESQTSQSFKIRLDAGKSSAALTQSYSDEWGAIHMKRFVAAKEGLWLNLKLAEE
jgi:hypothetical protein